jgi:hypothetical protein
VRRLLVGTARPAAHAVSTANVKFSGRSCLLLSLAPGCRGEFLYVCVVVSFSKQVTQGAIRSVANSVFRHLHGMDLGFHLSRQVRGSCQEAAVSSSWA